MIFEQLNNNILIDNRVVFTLRKLEDFVIAEEFNYTGHDEENCINETPFEIGYKSEIVPVDIPVIKWLDNEDNFQMACKELFKQLK